MVYYPRRQRRKYKKAKVLKGNLKKAVDTEIKKMMHPERKQAGIFTTSSNLVDYTNPIIFNVNTPSTVTLQQGPMRNQRIGDVISISEMYCNLLVQLNQSTVSNSDSSIRVVIIYIKDAGGANPPSTDLFFTVASSITAMSALNIDTVPSRFRVLHDQVYNFRSGSSGISTVNNSARIIKIHKKYKVPLKTTFVQNSTATGAPAIDQGLIAAYIVGSGPLNNTLILQEAYGNIVYTDS